tara:strand:- start:66 stop:602 length:537 start_codon:yes stop_codon:yes gene_type:complete
MSFKSSISLDQQIINFANLTNFVALKAGALKKEQMLSGDMADIFSNLYLALSVIYYHKHNNASQKLTDYIVNRLINENQGKINKVIDNLGPERFLVQHMKEKVKVSSYCEEREIFNEIMNNETILNEIKKNIYVGNNILGDLDTFNKYDKKSSWNNMLQERIINVDEFPISEISVLKK